METKTPGTSFNFVTQTPGNLGETGQNRVDFQEDRFNVLIEQKGRDVIIEKSIPCPCKSKSTNQQSDCKNCSGTGWLFINPTRTKAIVQGMSISTDYKNWSELDRGTINISVKSTEELSIMDRVTVLDGESISSEVLHFSLSDKGQLFSYSCYKIKEILYSGLFLSSNQSLKKLELNKDFTFRDNKVLLNLEYSDLRQYVADYEYLEDSPSITIRYKHYPTYHILEMKRETMQSYLFSQNRDLRIDLPVSGVARKVQYIDISRPLNNTPVLDNNSITLSEEKCLSKVVELSISEPVLQFETLLLDNGISKLKSYSVFNSLGEEIQDYSLQPDNLSLTFIFENLFTGKLKLVGIPIVEE